MPFSKEQQASFDKLYAKACDATEDMRLVKMKDDLLAALLAADEARLKHMNPKAMGPHRKNRLGCKNAVVEDL